MAYVLAAYGITIAVIGGYIVSVFFRRRAAERALAALEEPEAGTDVERPPA